MAKDELAEHIIRANIYEPKRVEKSWGFELWIANTEKYCGKLLHVMPTKKCSLHFHVLKHETFYIHSGKVLMTLIHKDGLKEDIMMYPGDTLEVPRGLVHRFQAIDTEVDIYEFSTEHFDSDSYRVDKGD